MPRYSDLNLNFIKHPNTRDVLKRYDLDAVKNAVRNIIKCNRGEKLFKPNFGGSLRGMLFENITNADSELLKRKWNEMLLMYEPRAVIDNIDITVENNEMYIVLYLSLKETPEVQFSLPLAVDRVR